MDDKLFNKRLLAHTIEQNQLLKKILEGVGASEKTIMQIQPSAEFLAEIKNAKPKVGVDYFTEKDRAEICSAATPVKGKDYFTNEDIAAFKKAVTPRKGIDYVDGNDGVTPKKGVDYFTEKEVRVFLKKVTPKKGADYRDGRDADEEKIIKAVIAKTKDIRSDRERALEIVRLLESLIPKGNEKDRRLRAKAIRGLQNYGGGGGGAVTGTIGVTGGGTGLTTVVTGDILYASAADTLSRRAIGSAGDILTVSGGLPVWASKAAVLDGTYLRLDAANGPMTESFSIVKDNGDATITFSDTAYGGSAFTIGMMVGSATMAYFNGETTDLFYFGGQSITFEPAAGGLTQLSLTGLTWGPISLGGSQAPTILTAPYTTGTNVNGSSFQLKPGNSAGTGTSGVELWASGGGASGSAASNAALVASFQYNGVTFAANYAITTTGALTSGAISATQATVGTVVQTLKSTATSDDPTEQVYQNRVTTTNNTATTLHTFIATASMTTYVEAQVVARRTGGSGGTAEDGAAYLIRIVVKNVAGTATIIGAATTTTVGESQAGWDATMDVATNTIRVRVTGETNNNITWHMTARVWQVGT